jgi:hypothetical protein
MKIEDSPICKSGNFCVLCRDSSQVEAREHFASRFEVPIDWPNCPLGKQMVQVNVVARPSTLTRIVTKIARNERMAARITRRRRPGETGVGDTLERIIAAKGGDFFKKAYKKLMGRSCGCGDAKARLNREFPYPVE